MYIHIYLSLSIYIHIYIYIYVISIAPREACVIHCDLKPENVLLSNMQHTRISELHK